MLLKKITVSILRLDLFWPKLLHEPSLFFHSLRAKTKLSKIFSLIIPHLDIFKAFDENSLQIGQHRIDFFGKW